MNAEFREKVKEKLEDLLIKHKAHDMLKLLNLPTPLLIQIYAWIKRDGMNDEMKQFLDSLYDAWASLDNVNILEKVLARPSFTLIVREKADKINELLKELARRLAKYYIFWLELEVRGIIDLMEGKADRKNLMEKFECIKRELGEIIKKIIGEIS